MQKMESPSASQSIASLRQIISGVVIGEGASSDPSAQYEAMIRHYRNHPDRGSNPIGLLQSLADLEGITIA
jgi:hypothetical protein